MNNPFDEYFGKPISVYTDAQALDDGVLVAVTEGGVNRVTRAVFDHFTRSIGDPRYGVTDVTALREAIRVMLARTPEDSWRTGTYQGKALWLIPNEVRGLTLMFPEDY